MKTVRHNFNYNVLTPYHEEAVFIWNLNEYLISLLLTLCYIGLERGRRQLQDLQDSDGQVFVPSLVDREKSQKCSGNKELSLLATRFFLLLTNLTV